MHLLKLKQYLKSYFTKLCSDVTDSARTTYTMIMILVTASVYVIGDSGPAVIGPKGEQGLPGFPGVSGNPGIPGLPGGDGIPGMKGKHGDPGLYGSNGN